MYDLLEILVWTIGGVAVFTLIIFMAACMASGHFVLGLGTFALVLFILLSIAHEAL